jgi:myo-inositol-1(or 4)-monophosphatase
MPIAIADVRQIVDEAGRLALLYYGKVSGSLKADLSMVSEAYHAVEHFVRLSLTALAPDYGYIGEETEESRPPTAGETRSWVVDALDGSRAFVSGLPLWMPAVSLMEGDRPIAGAAINPITGELFWPTTTARPFNETPSRPTWPSMSGRRRSSPGRRTTTGRSPDFPGRIYCLGAPITSSAWSPGRPGRLFFDPAVNLWDVACRSSSERTGGVLSTPLAARWTWPS